MHQKGQDLYNRFFLASLELPTGALEFSQRLARAKELMDCLKQSSVGPIATNLAESLLALGLDGAVMDAQFDVCPSLS